MCYLFLATNGDYVGTRYSFDAILGAGVDYIQCNHYDDNNHRLRENFNPQVEHLHLGDLRTTFYNRAGNVALANITPSTTCWFPGRKLYFNYLGDMLVCCADWTFADPVGNIHIQTLRELLRSPKIKLYQDYLSQNRSSELPLCSQCNLIRHQEVMHG